MSEPSPASQSGDVPLIEARGLWKRFAKDGGETVVLRDVSLRVEPGEMLAIVGASGAGKSTLLHILGTLELPSEGTLHFKGQALSTQSQSALARFRNSSLGFIFQFHHLLPDFNALENVMMPGLIGGTGRKALRARAEELLEAVSLSHRTSHRPSELSGGEQQRVAIARALMMRPDLVLADEPTGNLDTQTGERVCELLNDLNARFGTSFVVVTHSRELAESLPRCISMKDGVIVEDRVSLRPASGTATLATDAAPESAPSPEATVG